MLTHRGIQDFGFRTQEDQLRRINQQIRNARISGGIIAGISLIIGGIGIMNIMLASINERIREIGISKAVGATGLAVFTQVLIESMVIALFGAALGILASFAFVALAQEHQPDRQRPGHHPLTMLVAVAFSAAVGIVAGLFPAFKAARLDPIQALSTSSVTEAPEVSEIRNPKPDVKSDERSDVNLGFRISDFRAAAPVPPLLFGFHRSPAGSIVNTCATGTNASWTACAKGFRSHSVRVTAPAKSALASAPCSTSLTCFVSYACLAATAASTFAKAAQNGLTGTPPPGSLRSTVVRRGRPWLSDPIGPCNSVSLHDERSAASCSNPC